MDIGSAHVKRTDTFSSIWMPILYNDRPIAGGKVGF